MTDDLPILDTQQLLDAFGEIDDEVREMMRLFVDTTGPILRDLELAATARNRQEAEDLAHSAKGAARSAGAMRLAAACATVEAAAELEDWMVVDESLAGLQPALDDVAAAIETL